MTEIILFGGTTEGRALCEVLDKKCISTLVCVATEYGESLLPAFNSVRVHAGRLDELAIKHLLESERPRLVIDATHPYAVEISKNVRAACRAVDLDCLRLLRTPLPRTGSATFLHLPDLIHWLNRQTGTVFSTLGAKEVSALTAVDNYQNRIWLRILPDPAGLSACLSAGFSARRIICMQGPFSKELNAAMFRETRADILITKESGKTGGFEEKAEAALECGMRVAVLSRPCEEDGLTLLDMTKLIEEDQL